MSNKIFRTARKPKMLLPMEGLKPQRKRVGLCVLIGKDKKVASGTEPNDEAMPRKITVEG